MIVVLAILGLIVILLGLAAAKPNSFRIERAATIAAPPAKVFAFVNDFHQWTHWSPWEKLDPDLKRSYSGAASGQGAVYEWSGNNKAGAGRMEITEATANSIILIQLDFQRPMQARNTTEFTFTEDNGATRVVWAMFGPATLMYRLMTIFVNAEKFVGKDFEKGLASLKAVAEG